MTDSDFAFLEDAEPEFDFIEGVEGGSHIADWLEADDGRGLVDAINSLPTETWQESTDYLLDQKPPAGPRTPKGTPASRMAEFIYKCTKPSPPIKPGTHWPLPWPMHHFVWQAPEGIGKSSVVPELVQRGFHVVFCAKTNDQLVGQAEGFKARWPELRLHRHISKGRHLQEQLMHLGIEFELTYYESASPYAAAQLDEPTTRQHLRRALDDAGFTDVDHWVFFDKLYTNYKPPQIVGREVDVVLMTISSFQSMCTSKYMPWWERVGLLTGRKRKVERKNREYEVEIGLEKIVVVIDDPDRTDFDFRRLVADKDSAKLLSAQSKVPMKERAKVDPQHWIKLGHGPLLAKEMAEYARERHAAHVLETFEERYFEARPVEQHIGWQLQRGYPKSSFDRGTGASTKSGTIPKILVTTTEHLTAHLARETLGRVMAWASEARHRTVRPMSLAYECHVTLLSTRLVRQGNKALLLLIAEKLKQEFPDQHISLIADGLGCDLNLSNSRGRNDLAQHSTIVKLSVPHLNVALNLWAQFPASEKPRALNTILLADLANQAIGRNQGNRYQGKPCAVLVDPMYAKLLVQSKLLRYHCTPWSFHAPAEQVLPFHYPVTAFEQRLMEYLEPANARRLGMSLAGLEIGANLPDNQRKHYEAWLDAEQIVFPWPRVEA